MVFHKLSQEARPIHSDYESIFPRRLVNMFRIRRVPAKRVAMSTSASGFENPEPLHDVDCVVKQLKAKSLRMLSFCSLAQMIAASLHMANGVEKTTQDANSVLLECSIQICHLAQLRAPSIQNCQELCPGWTH